MVIGFCFLFLFLGIWRYQIADNQIINNDFRSYNDGNEIINLIGTVADEPDLRQTHTKLTLDIENLKGKILVNTEKYPAYQYGDKLKITGLLNNPGQFNGFNYKDYLAKEGIYSVVYYPEIELIERNKRNFFYAAILSFKNSLREVVYQNLSLPQSSILAAMILGDKRQIPGAWQEKLNHAGVRHLTAISGMHVAILTVILMTFLLALGFWRQQAFYFTIILMAFFVIITGLQPSAIRASIMAAIFLLAQYLGKMSHSLRALVFVALLMILHNPLLLRLDVGFQLSFLAMLGIIYFLPFFQSLLQKIPLTLQLKKVLAMTLSAQIFTLPILIYNFGYFSVVGIITNILIVPLLPFIMGLGLIFVLLGTVWNVFAWLISFPLWILLSYLTLIVDWFSGLKSSVYFIEISWPWLIICYLFLGFIAQHVEKKERGKLLRF